MLLPESIRKHLPDSAFSLDSIGCSDAQVMMFPDRVLKVQGDCNVSGNEFYMLSWLQGRLPVPEIIAADHVDGMRYLLMTRMSGKVLCDEAILNDQHRLAELVAEGLRHLWSVDIAGCPTNRTLDRKFIEIEEGLRGGWITPEQAAQPETYGPKGFRSPAHLFDWLVKNRPVEELVLSHGDYCLPNIFASDKGLTGFIDIGLSGVADKWIDIEKGLWSMWANTTGVFGGKKRGFDRRLLFDALGVQPDEDRLRYYSLLDELC
ncbi:MAG: aminoglycoside 3'-phosphotransferase [Clostridia bacterium]|nr:aminoglycoside 3'-phosphotransferase [Clostridia bacterium]